MLVDRAAPVDQHRAVPPLVVAQQHVAAGRRGAGNSSSAGMWASVSASSGSMGTNCDDVQQAVQPSHGHIGAVLAADRLLHLLQPGGEVPGVELGVVATVAQVDARGVGPVVGPAVVPVPSHVAAHVLVHGVAITAHACMPIHAWPLDKRWRVLHDQPLS